MKDAERIVVVAVFLASLAIFSAVRSRLVGLRAAGPAQARFLTGDEPAYMLLTHSLVTDGDFNLYNNRVNGDGRAFGMERCDEHGARKDWNKKEIYSIHTSGLTVLIAPAYRLGLHGPISPRAVVCVFLSILAALLAVNVYLFSREICCGGAGDPKPPRWLALLATAAVMFTPPVIFYSNLAYPELPAALFILYALRHAIAPSRRAADSPCRRLAVSPFQLPISLAVAFLPWLSFRFFIPAFILLYLLIRQPSQRTPICRYAATIYVLPFAVSLVLFFSYQYRAFGSISPAAGYAYQDFARRGYASKGVLDGVIGLILDSGHGVLTWSPVYILSFTGLFLLIRERHRLGILLVILLLSIYLPGACFVFWWGGFAPPPRYMVVPAPLLGVALCYALSRKPRRSFAVLFGLLLATSLIFGAVGCYKPGLLYRHRHIVANYWPAPMTKMFPSFFRKGPATWPLAAAWGAAILLLNGYFFFSWPDKRVPRDGRNAV